MQKQAQVVIIGSGIVGCSAAYHLAKLGWRDILVIDKGDSFENDGSTSHAPGGVVALSHSKLLTQMAIYSSDLYASLRPYHEDRHSYNPVGFFEIAISDTRWADLKRLKGEAAAFGVEAHLVNPAEVQEKVPLINTDAFVGGLFVPKGAIIAGAHVSGGLARDASEMSSMRFVGHTALTDVEVENGRIKAVQTNNPDLPRIECEYMLLCANIWSPALSEKMGVKLPLMAFAHQYAISTPLEPLAQFDPANKDHEIVYPTMRELDSTMYYRQHWDSYGVGSYWHRPLMVHPRNVGKSATLDFTPEDFTDAWQQAQRILPALEGADLTTKFNGMFAFSADGYPIIGESDVRGLWVATASWITHAGGVGKAVAEWMTEGETEWDMRQCHVQRFHPFQTTQKYVDTVTGNNYREVYDIIHPAQPPTAPRNVRLTPFWPRLQELDAEFSVFAGFEVANWYASNSRLLEHYDEQIPDRSGWAGQYWSRIQGAEHLATRANVALFDLTSLSIIEVTGPGTVGYLNYLCSSQMDKAVGSVIYTTWLTESGGVRRDLAVARLAEDQYWLFVGEGTLPMDLAWVRSHAPQDGSVMIHDVSSQYSALGLWGPNARNVLAKVTDADVSNAAFPYFTNQWIDIGAARVLALRISYAGELGWELHIPTDFSLPVWDVLWAAGREFEMVPAGMGAFGSLRIEKGYRLWGGDVHTEYSPYESGLGWTVHLKKEDFIGRDACRQLKAQPLKKKLCCMTLDNPGAVALGYEPIYANGECVSYVTSGNFGYSIGKYIIYGYLPMEHAQVGTKLAIEYFGERHTVTVADEPLWDPQMARLKG